MHTLKQRSQHEFDYDLVTRNNAAFSGFTIHCQIKCSETEEQSLRNIVHFLAANHCLEYICFHSDTSLATWIPTISRKSPTSGARCTKLTRHRRASRSQSGYSLSYLILSMFLR